MGIPVKNYTIEVEDQRSMGTVDSDGKLTSGVYVFIYDAGTKTLSTIYSDDKLTAKTNPISRAQFATDEGIKFWSTSDSHDLFIAHSDGSVARLTSVTPTTHSIKLNRDGLDKCMVFPIAASAGGTETDTGLDLPKICKVYDVALEVVTLDAGETVTIGLLSSETNGDADGLMLSTSVATAGFYQLYEVTDGATEDYISAVRAGALMGIGSVGTNAANDFGQPGGPGHIVSGSNATSISYTPSSSDTLAGYGYVYFRHLR
jgi:hypothetical protein